MTHPSCRRRHRRLLAAAAAALSLLTTAAHADKPLWELGLGAGWLHLPHYRGSDQTRNWLLPIPYFVYRGEVFSADREGARAKLVDNPQGLDIDLSAAVNTPTRSQDNQARQGMSNLAPTVEAGPSVNLLLVKSPGWLLDLRLPARAVFTVQRQPRVIGWTVNPSLHMAGEVRNWDVVLQGGPVLSSRSHHRYFYDVSAADSRPGRPAYSSRGGYAGWVATASASRRLGELWVGTYLQADGLSGAVFSGSPLLRQRLNISGGIGLSWVFSESQARARDGS